jgi:hypothetical protein
MFIIFFASHGSVVERLYLNLDYDTLVFSLLFDHQRFNIYLQHLTHIHITINHISLLSHSHQHHSRLKHFRIYFVDNDFEKTY